MTHEPDQLDFFPTIQRETVYGARLLTRLPELAAAGMEVDYIQVGASNAEWLVVYRRAPEHGNKKVDTSDTVDIECPP